MQYDQKTKTKTKEVKIFRYVAENYENEVSESESVSDISEEIKTS